MRVNLSAQDGADGKDGRDGVTPTILVEAGEEIDNPEYVEIYDVNTIANYDVTIIPYLHSESDTAFERIECKNDFRIVKI